jgi:hypothetical protein
MELDDWLAMTEADHREREARNHEIVGDVLAPKLRCGVTIVGSR